MPTTEHSAASLPVAHSAPRSDSSETFTKSGFWRWLRKGLNVTLLGAAGTALVFLIQNYSAYQDKVSAVAKNDMDAATETFTYVLNTLSVSLALQGQLISDYYKAIRNKTDGDDNSLLTTSARSIYKSYTDSYTTLRENDYLLVAKTEL